MDAWQACLGFGTRRAGMTGLRRNRQPELGDSHIDQIHTPLLKEVAGQAGNANPVYVMTFVV